MRSLFSFAKYLLSPWMILAGIGTGGYLGLYHHDIVDKISIFGEAYLNLLKMCVIPILMTSIIYGLGSMLQLGASGRYITRIVIVFISSLFLASAMGLVAGILFEPGVGLDKSAQVTMGRQIAESEISANSQGHLLKDKSVGISGFFLQMIPNNVFLSITEERNLSILVFVVFLGVAIGVNKNPAAHQTLEMVNVVYESMLRIIEWTMYALPFGLMCLVATQISQIGMEILAATLKLVVMIYATSLGLVLIYFLLIRFYSNNGLWHSIRSLREPLLIALGSSSSFTAVPSALMQLKNQLGCDHNSAKLVLPLGISLNPSGSALHFSISAVFVAQLYGVDILANWPILLIGGVLAGIAASGSPGIAALSMIAIITDPLGLPTGVAITLLAAIDPIVDPILTMVTVQANCTAPIIVSASMKKTDGKGEIHE